MPKTKISEYSATANSNTDVASINIDEGCAPSGINNAIRAVMGHLKDFQTGTASDPLTVGGALTTSSTVTHSAGTANGVAYLNGSKVLTTGSALVFDGTNLGVGGTPSAKLEIAGSSGNVQFSSVGNRLAFTRNGANYIGASGASGSLNYAAATYSFYNESETTERMRLDSSGNLGIGTSSPTFGSGSGIEIERAGSNATLRLQRTTSNTSTLELRADSLSAYLETRESVPLIFGINAVEVARIDSSGNLLVTGSGILGYGSGSGGTVTQATSRTTGVTLNKTNGQITLVSAAGSTTIQSFTVTNSTVSANDVVVVSQKSGTDLYRTYVTNVAAGSFKISFATLSGTTTEQPVFNFAVFNVSTS